MRRRTSSSASAAGRPVARAMAGARGLGLQAAPGAAATARAVGLDDDVADVAGVAVVAVEQATVEDDARRRRRSTRPWPGSPGRRRRRRASPRRGPGPWRRCRWWWARPVWVHRRSSRGKPRQASMFTGETDAPPPVIGPPVPTPQATGRRTPGGEDVVDQRRRGWRRGPRRRCRHRSARWSGPRWCRGRRSARRPASSRRCRWPAPGRPPGQCGRSGGDQCSGTADSGWARWGRTTTRAAMATSIWASSGGRVVSACRARPGAVRTATTLLSGRRLASFSTS